MGVVVVVGLGTRLGRRSKHACDASMRSVRLSICRRSLLKSVRRWLLLSFELSWGGVSELIHQAGSTRWRWSDSRTCGSMVVLTAGAVWLFDFHTQVRRVHPSSARTRVLRGLQMECLVLRVSCLFRLIYTLFWVCRTADWQHDVLMIRVIRQRTVFTRYLQAEARRCYFLCCRNWKLGGGR